MSRYLPDRFTQALIAVVLLATFLPPPERFDGLLSAATSCAIALMFFLYGARLSTAAVIEGLMHWRFHLVVFLATFGLFPLIGLAAGSLAAKVMPATLASGLLFMTLLPSTVQSSLAFTAIAGGNVAAAMCAATISSLAGTVVTPLLVAALMGGAGGASTLDAIKDICILLLLPFAAGQILRPWIGGFVTRHKPILGLTDRGSILLVVYAAFGHAVRMGLWSALPPMSLAALVAMACGILALMLCSTWLAARALGFDRADTIAVVFCGSKKSLATGVPMAGVLFAGPDLGMILLPIMLFHQIQLMVCAALARRWAAQGHAPALT